MTVATEKPACAARYQASVMLRAVELREAGWPASEIPGVLCRELGVRPDYRTILRWTTPGLAERRQAAQRDEMRRRRARLIGGRLRMPRKLTPEFKQARIESLRARGMSYAAVANVMDFDFPEDGWNAELVRYRFRRRVSEAA